MSSHSEYEILGKRKRGLDEDEEMLQLVLEPSSIPVKRRRLGAHPCLHVDCRNCLEGSINDNKCKVQLDSGANFTMIFWNLAKRLGVITGQEPTTVLDVDLWLGPMRLDVVELESVTIKLGPGVVVNTPATVFPEWLDDYYDADFVVLDAHQLRRGRMVQVFRPDGCDIFVTKPQQLLRGVKKTQKSIQSDLLKVKSAHSGTNETMTMMLDTGAVGIHVSKRRRKLLAKSRKRRELPKRVVLDIGDGCYLEAEPLEEVGLNKYDFITGTALLGRYNAMLDYARHSLTFLVGSQWRKVNTQ